MNNSMVYRNGIPFERERDFKTGKYLPMESFLPPKLHMCPFCGEHVQMQIGYKGGGWRYTEPNGEYWAECIACGAGGPHLDSEQSAAAEWNSVF